MRTLYLLRHSLTEANEGRLYCGRTDLPLSARGRALAREMRENRPLPVFDLCASSGMRRADETLALLTGRGPDRLLPDLREMDFGRFEMRSHETLKDDPDYLRWIGDGAGEIPCPGGEASNRFRARVLRGGAALLEIPWDRAIVVCHGGTVVRLMEAWFPGEARGFYEWQPGPCRGWRVVFENKTPVGFEGV